jgi:hypothetical protein
MSDATPQTASQEQRRESRQRKPAAYTGVIVLRDGRTQVEAPVVALRDCSPSGASVLTRQAYEPGHLISLIVSSDGIPTEHMGTVAWCRATSESDLGDHKLPRGSLVFTVGLQMRGPVSLASSLAVRP